nr:hypothetical protein [uncultured Schaedlerella sp.]
MISKVINGQIVRFANKGGGGGSGTNNYNDLSYKPSINGVELIGNRNFDSLGINKMTNKKILQIINQAESKGE